MGYLRAGLTEWALAGQEGRPQGGRLPCTLWVWHFANSFALPTNYFRLSWFFKLPASCQKSKHFSEEFTPITAVQISRLGSHPLRRPQEGPRMLLRNLLQNLSWNLPPNILPNLLQNPELKPNKSDLLNLKSLRMMYRTCVQGAVRARAEGPRSDLL